MIKRVPVFCFLVLTLFSPDLKAQHLPANADQLTPSHSLYYDYANQNGQGTNEHKILADLSFFKWMHDTYGMKLDYFLMDAGVIDNALLCHPSPGKAAYGSLSSPWFIRHFPDRFKNISEYARSFDCRLGLTIGPDGFGSSSKEASKRVHLMADLCRDYGFGLFKLDGCVSKIREDKEKYLEQSILKARAINADLLVTSSGLKTETVTKYLAVSDWAGQQAYTDVNEFNTVTATNHRLGSIDRPALPALDRLKDDKGVNLSSALDFWEDDLVLQAFNRNTLFSPEIFGNPWLLKDDEFPRLARIFNLHERYNEILVHGMMLPRDRYGENAVSRGDGENRLITLRNLSWLPKKYTITIDNSIGIKADGTFMVKQVFPTEKYIGRYMQGGTVEITVDPFHAALFLVTLHSTEVDLRGCDYELIQALPGKPVVVKLLGLPGQKVKLSWGGSEFPVTTARLAGSAKPAFFRKGVSFRFPGSKSANDYHHKIGYLSPFSLTPEEARYIYEGSCFSADNNALEVRSLQRAGQSQVREVNLARNAFLLDSTFIDQGAWDKYAFDGERNTFFKAGRTLASQEKPGVFRLDLGRSEGVDQLVMEDANADFNPAMVEISVDLKHWTSCPAQKEPARLVVNFPPNTIFRCMRIQGAPTRVAEIRAFHHGQQIGRSGWHASNLFGSFEDHQARQAWKYSFKVRKAGNNNYLALSVPGNYARESVYATLMVNGHLMGAADRSPSFPYNNWAEYGDGTGNYTFYFPLTKAMLKKKLDLIVVSSDKEAGRLSPEVWQTAYPVPYEQKILTLK